MTATEFKELFPEFSGYADSRIELMLSQSEQVIAESAYGDAYTNAIAFHTAHLLTLTDPANASLGGPIIGEKVGKLSTTYGDPTKNGGSDAYYDLTHYGRAFKELRNARVISAVALR